MMANREKQYDRECQAAYLMVKDNLDEKLIAVDELAAALQQAGRNPTQKMLAKFWTNGGVTFDQFCRILKEFNQPSIDQLKNAFRKLDRNRDGSISFQELKAMLLKKDESLSDKELREIFSEADLNKDGTINYEEFVNLMRETMEETKRQALAQLEKRERREARRKKRERREQALNGSGSASKASNGGSPTSAKDSDQQSTTSSDGSSSIVITATQFQSSSGSATQNSKVSSSQPTASEVSDITANSVILQQFKHQIKRKGCFLYDIDSEEEGGGGRVDIVSQQYKIRLDQSANVRLSLWPTGNPDLKESELIDTMLAIVDAANGRVYGVTEEKENAIYSIRCHLNRGEYWLLPFTTGCRFKPRPAEMNSKSRTELLIKGKEGSSAMKLTKEFRMILMNIFDACDLDDNGTLCREEFNIYNVRTGDEQVTDQEWKVVQENFDKKNGEITIKGFLDLHQLEADDSNGDTEDMWISLQAMGYNNRLQLDEACPFTLEIGSDQPISSVTVSEIQPISQRVWESMAEYLSGKTNRQQDSTVGQLKLCCYRNENWAALIAENRTSESMRSALSLSGSENFLISPADVIKRELIFRASSTSILCFLLRKDDEQEWAVRARLSEA